MTQDQALHLLNRLGYGASPVELERWSQLSQSEAVAQLLAGTDTSREVAPPEWVDELPLPRKERSSLSVDDKRAQRQRIRSMGLELKGWWLREMVVTKSPLSERMTLFWHNHFTSSLRKVKWPPLLYQQNKLFHRYALGNFRHLLHDVARDPAMVIYLDNVTNRKGKPNENFARELLELFTLGEGNYSEKDVKAAAQAFTGWSVNQNDRQFQVRRRWHDNAEKQFLGEQGRLDGDDVIAIILKQKRVAELITEKLWREFISSVPDKGQVKRLATLFRTQNYEVRPLLEALILTPEFWAEENRASLIIGRKHTHAGYDCA